jgi:hypothetical protein
MAIVRELRHRDRHRSSEVELPTTERERAGPVTHEREAANILFVRWLGGALVVCALGGCEIFGTSESPSDGGSAQPQGSLDASVDASPDALDGSVDGGTAPVFDELSSGTTVGSKITFDHTVGSGPNRLLLVAWHVGSFTDLEKVTYAGETLNALEPTTQFNVGERQCGSRLFYLVNPRAGTAPVVAELESWQVKPMAAFAMSFHGVDPTAPLGAITHATGAKPTNTTATVQVDSAPNELIVDSLCLLPKNSSADPVDAGPGQTMRASEQVESLFVFGSTAPGGPGRSMTWTFMDAAFSLHAVALRPAR